MGIAKSCKAVAERLEPTVMEWTWLGPELGFVSNGGMWWVYSPDRDTRGVADFNTRFAHYVKEGMRKKGFGYQISCSHDSNVIAEFYRGLIAWAKEAETEKEAVVLAAEEALIGIEKIYQEKK